MNLKLKGTLWARDRNMEFILDLYFVDEIFSYGNKCNLGREFKEKSKESLRLSFVEVVESLA